MYNNPSTTAYLQIHKQCFNQKKGDFQIIARAVDNNQSADKVSVSLELKSLEEIIKRKS